MGGSATGMASQATSAAGCRRPPLRERLRASESLRAPWRAFVWSRLAILRWPCTPRSWWARAGVPARQRRALRRPRAHPAARRPRGRAALPAGPLGRRLVPRASPTRATATPTRRAWRSSRSTRCWCAAWPSSAAARAERCWWPRTWSRWPPSWRRWCCCTGSRRSSSAAALAGPTLLLLCVFPASLFLGAPVLGEPLPARAPWGPSTPRARAAGPGRARRPARPRPPAAPGCSCCCRSC